MKLLNTLTSSENAPSSWRLPPLPGPSAAEAQANPEPLNGNVVFLGAQVMPYGVVINARKSPRDIYED